MPRRTGASTPSTASVSPTPPEQRIPPLRQMRRYLVCQTWRRLPNWAQHVAFRLVTPKVSLGACAVVCDARGQVLFAHHTYRREGAWSLPGGLVRRDEQPAAALARELREELNAQARIGPLLHAETHLPSRHLTLYYLATLTEAPRVDGVELDSYRFVPRAEAATLLGQGAHTWLPQPAQPPQSETRKAS